MQHQSLSSLQIGIVILTWNGRDLTLECLESLASIRTTDTVIRIVVDNASNDGTVAAIRSRWGDDVTIIANATNEGFSRGNNAGIQRALDAGCDAVLLLNNDTVVDPDFLSEMAGALRADTAVGIAAPKIYYYAQRDQIWFAGGEVSLGRGTARHIGIRERDVGQHDTPRDIGYATGCALLARREVFQTIGLLDPSYMAYYEDTDFCMRARRAGYRIRYVPAARVWHKISASSGGQLSRKKVMRKFRSTWKFFGRYARPRHWLTIPFFFTADVLRIILLVFLGRIRNDRKSTPSATI